MIMALLGAPGENWLEWDEQLKDYLPVSDERQAEIDKVEKEWWEAAKRQAANAALNWAVEMLQREGELGRR